MMTVETKSIPFSMNFVAQTESSRQVEIMARWLAFDRIAYGEGDFVKQGQILFQIDPKPFEAQLEAARGELGAQKARMINAQANLRRASSRWPSKRPCRNPTSITPQGATKKRWQRRMRRPAATKAKFHPRSPPWSAPCRLLEPPALPSHRRRSELVGKRR